MKRQCGDCQACCKILPTSEINKPALTKCPHQRVHKGCTIYHTRPFSCRIWSCVWLMGDDLLRRPDHCHYVVDPMPDVAIATQPGKPDVEIQVIQVWVDPKYPDAHRDPGLRQWLALQGEQNGMTSLIRYGSERGFSLIPPALSHDGQWHELHEQSMMQEWSTEQRLERMLSSEQHIQRMVANG